MDNKIKDKIEKLLNLSMSDSEHEASLALKRAMELMQKHNITKEEVMRQNFVSQQYTLKYNRLPDWLTKIYSSMSMASGCICTTQKSVLGTKVRICGRQRDVDNASYLISFLLREIKQRAKEQEKTLSHHTTQEKKTLLKSFKVGIVIAVYEKIEKQNRTFFNEQSKGTDLVCMDIEQKCKDAEAHLRVEFEDIKKSRDSQARYTAQGLRDGRKAGEDIDINPAVAQQRNIRQIGTSR